MSGDTVRTKKSQITYDSRGYFTDSGLDYSIGRTNIGGCDFSPRPYTYLDTPNDTAMETFALQVEDFDFKARKMKVGCR